jgi:hypothetical protein
MEMGNNKTRRDGCEALFFLLSECSGHRVSEKVCRDDEMSDCGLLQLLLFFYISHPSSMRGELDN